MDNKIILNVRSLRLSLKYRPKILRYILKLQEKVRKKNKLLKYLKKELLKVENSSILRQHVSCQTEEITHDLIKVSSESDIEGNKVPNYESKIIHCQTEANTNVVQTKNSSSQTEFQTSCSIITDNTPDDFQQSSDWREQESVCTSSQQETPLDEKHLFKQNKDSDELQEISNKSHNISTDVPSSQAGATDTNVPKREASSAIEPKSDAATPVAWDGANAKSIADQVKEAAQSAIEQSGMVYVESAGMYYDYKTGYYYSPELGLYYHSDTGCYYYYSNEKQEFVFHSYPDTSMSAAYEALSNHEKKKAKKHKQDKEKDVADKTKKRRKKTKKENGKTKSEHKVKTDESSEVKDVLEDESKADLEDGECSVTEDENETTEDDEDSSNSTPNASDDESVARSHPPCMRLIVQATALLTLKVGSLFLITKDGGSIGREGKHHTIVLGETNVSREHLHITYNKKRKVYVAMDLGSRNGTLLNGTRMSKSQVVSSYMEVPHGSVIQMGETRLLCHIHPGNATCGHCEPGLLMIESNETDKKLYTNTCSIQKQHQLELARLKNKFGPEPLAIEDASYKDRAKERREEVGSSHSAEKTQQSDLETNISSENKGFRLLQKMGWSEGEGLGKNKQGNIEPIPLVSNEHKAGLGALGSAAPVVVGQTGMVLHISKKRPRTVRQPAKAFRDALEDGDTE